MKKLSKREKILVIIAIIAAIFFLANLYIIKPFIVEYSELQDKKDMLNLQKQSMNINISMNESHKQSLEAKQIEYKDMSTQIMENKSFVEINEILVNEFSKYNLTITEFEIDYKKIDENEEDEENSVLTILQTDSVTVNAQGEIQNIYNLIHDLSKDSKTDVIDFIITEQGQGQPYVVLIDLEYVMYK